MGIRFSLAAVVALVLASFLGVKAAGLNHFFGVTLPYIAIFAFLVGIVFRIVKWGTLTRSLPDSDHGRPAEIPAMDQTEQT